MSLHSTPTLDPSFVGAPNALKYDLKKPRIMSHLGPIWPTLESSLPSLLTPARLLTFYSTFFLSTWGNKATTSPFPRRNSGQVKGSAGTGTCHVSTSGVSRLEDNLWSCVVLNPDTGERVCVCVCRRRVITTHYSSVCFCNMCKLTTSCVHTDWRSWCET